MRMELEKVLEFSIDNPSQQTISILQFDTEDCMAIVQGIERVGNLDLYQQKIRQSSIHEG